MTPTSPQGPSRLSHALARWLVRAAALATLAWATWQLLPADGLHVVDVEWDRSHAAPQEVAAETPGPALGPEPGPPRLQAAERTHATSAPRPPAAAIRAAP